MDEIITVALRGILLLTILWLFNGQYRQYRLDQYRQALFRIRDDLFEDAKTGLFLRPTDDKEYPFEAPAYTTYRTTVNGMIRFAHTLGLTRLVVMVIIHKYFLNDAERLIKEHRRDVLFAQHDLSPEARARLKDVEQQLIFRTMTFLLHTSILTWLILFPIELVLRSVNQLGKITNYVLRISHIRRWVVYRLFSAEANEIGRPSATV